ncbi:hypothetical protein R3P38DRAFT_3078418 [Favolaschia claudopus]|uniref:Hypervirulence associated protein TUDOR domain-containing protein n=1 Tax=Favolaschia claudopus TaxID=2862362 RepID=A0AAV9ZVC2_9AGAR
MPSTKESILDKNNEGIHEGDEVWTKFRGGKREGVVDKIVTTQSEAEDAGVKNPPKVLFTDQHGHDVAHNPGTLRRKE